jgi:hypothetical protein
MFDKTMKIGDLVVVTHKETTGDPDDRYFGILIVRPSFGLIGVVCNQDGIRRNFNPNDWDIEVLSASR